jgi:hypothetical protein
VLSMPGRAVLLARVPAQGLEGAQAGVHGGTAMSVCESEAAVSLDEEAWSWQVKVYHSAVVRGEEELARSSRWVTCVRLFANVAFVTQAGPLGDPPGSSSAVGETNRAPIHAKARYIRR